MKSSYRNSLISIVPLMFTAVATAEQQTQVLGEISAKQEHQIATGWRASEVIGTSVKNSSDDTIGEVEDLVIDMKSGNVLAVVVSSGGFLGVADTLSAIPSSALRYDQRAKGFKTKLTKEQLTKAPNFKKDKWPDYTDTTAWSGFNEYHNSLGENSGNADNTANNTRDRDNRNVTPEDQGNSSSDTETSRKIRSAIMDQDLSFNAKNVKIITKDGKVTLRGVVDQESEKDTILNIAKKHVDSTNVSNDLEVKGK